MALDFSDHGKSKGLIPRDFKSHPVGSLSYAPRMVMKTYPRDEWKDRIKEKTAAKSWIWDRCKNRIPILDQDGYGWCWNHSLAGAAMCAREAANLDFVQLSPCSLGYVVGWDMNSGAWIGDALKAIQQHGICASPPFPMLTHDPRYWDAKAQQIAAMHKFQCFDLDSNIWDELVTCALDNIVHDNGIHDWGHSTYGGVEMRWNDSKNRPEMRQVNSWNKTWGEDGTYWVWEGSQHYPNDAYAILVPDSVPLV